MFAITNPVLGLFGIAAMAAVVLGLRLHFSPESREARRRARNHGPVVSKKRGPSIHLAVNVVKAKQRRK